MNASPLDSLVGSIPVCILCILMLWIVIFVNRQHLFTDAKRTGTGWFVLWMVYTLYSVFYTPPTGDNYTSLQTYHAYWGGIRWEYLHYEEFHFKIMVKVRIAAKTKMAKTSSACHIQKGTAALHSAVPPVIIRET